MTPKRGAGTLGIEGEWCALWVGAMACRDGPTFAAAVGSRQENHRCRLVRGRTLLAFLQVMAIACADCQPVDGSELVDLFQRFRTEGLFSLECMKDDAFQQISYRHVLEFCRCFQDFQNPALNANAGLNPFDFYLFGSRHS